jgi:uncharacterized protein (TIGR03083 family)
MCREAGAGNVEHGDHPRLPAGSWVSRRPGGKGLVMARSAVGKDFWLTALRSDGAALRIAAAEPGALALVVPSCPEWRVGDLLRHVGSVYRYVRSHAGRGVTERPEQGVHVDDGTPSADDPAILPWFSAELAQLDAFLDALDPDLSAWNWAPQATVAGFWHRRMAHETAVHRWDAQLAIGLPEPIEAKLAGDTVAEVLDSWIPAGRRRLRAEAYGLVQLVAGDLGAEWYARLRGTGIALLDTDTLLDDDEHPARAAASGTASDLGLALWGRIAFDVLETAGDLTLLEALRVG